MIDKSKAAMHAITNSLKRTVVVCIAPYSDNEDERRHEYILNIILLISLLFLVILDGTIVYNIFRLGSMYHGIPLPVFGGLTLLCTLAIIGSKRGYAKIISYILITVYVFGSIYSGWHWGASLPATLLSFALIVVVSSVLAGSRFGFILSGILLIVLIILGYHEIYFLKELPWKNETIDRTDIVTYCAILVFIVGITWLSNSEIEKSLNRARTSEKLLQEEKDSLEIKVSERTSALRKAQIERTAELAHMIEFGKLSQGIFHDLMNPLNGLSLYMNTVKGVDIPEIKGAHEHILKAISASQKMGDVLVQIKKKIKTSSFTDEKDTSRETLSVQDECDSAISLYTFRARNANIAINKKYSNKDDILYAGCPIYFYRIFSNLIINALDALEQTDTTNKAITIDIKLIRLKTGDKTQRQIKIEVSDNGSGIPRQNIAKIFDPFFTTKGSSGGTGIGLTTVKDLVTEKLGGTISVDSEDRKGTRFKIVIPSKR
jgi:signal transduction histidine kinase